MTLGGHKKSLKEDKMRKFLFLIIILFIGLSCGHKSTPSKPECLVYPTVLRFPLCYYSDSCFFVIKNIGKLAFSGQISVKNETPSGWRYFYPAPKSYNLNPGDSVIIDVSFDDKWHGISAMEGTIETGCQACEDVYCIGY
jgi:hypothetical protein